MVTTGLPQMRPSPRSSDSICIYFGRPILGPSSGKPSENRTPVALPFSSANFSNRGATGVLEAGLFSTILAVRKGLVCPSSGQANLAKTQQAHAQKKIFEDVSQRI
jgi:hypothetical protein